MNVALYARISTRDKGQDSENQLLELRAWATRLGTEHVVEYVDRVSGTKGTDQRAALGRLMNDAHHKKVDTVLLWSLDRLTREGIEATLAYLRRFHQAGVVVRSHQEAWVETGGPTGELLLAIVGWMAKQERDRIAERVRAGLARVRAEGTKSGKAIGRPRNSIHLAEAREMVAGGASLRRTARLLDVSVRTLRRALAPSGSSGPGNGVDLDGDRGGHVVPVPVLPDRGTAA